jgi:hypothetical protein
MIAAAIGGVIGYLLLAALIVPAITLYVGWALSTLWAWFCVPLGLPALGVAHAAGMLLVLGMLRVRRHDDKKWAGHEIASYLLAPLIFVGIGYFLKGWM